MFLELIITAIVLAVLITLIFSLIFNNKGPWGAGFFFLILFFMMWAGGLWINPIGPDLWGVSWIPLLFLGLLTAVLLSAAKNDETKDTAESRSDNPPNPRDGEKRSVVTVSEDQHREAMAISIFFWVLMGGLIIAIIAGYLIV